MSRAPWLATVAVLATVASVAAAHLTKADDSAITRGARIAALGNGRGAIACASCHGFDGAADPSGAFPRLTGQTAAYLAHSLKVYADGGRRNALMTPIALALSEAERGDVAAYYASVQAAVPPARDADADQIELGRTIANVGLNDEQIPACVSCHGPFGRSVTPESPSLAGQYAPYVEAQFRMFRQGYRHSESMVGLAKALTDEQVRALALYFERAPGLTGPVARTAGLGISSASDPAAKP